MVTEKNAIIPTENILLQLTPEIINGLQTYEDFLAYYIQLDQASTVVSWVKADLLLHMTNKLGLGGIQALAKDIRQPRSTIINYVRTAKAFPTDQRDVGVSFSHHFQASFADEYDNKTATFLTDRRFGWIHKAGDENLSTRELQDQIQRMKQKEILGDPFKKCNHCGKNTGDVIKWVLYSPGNKKHISRLELHENCYLFILDFIYGKK